MKCPSILEKVNVKLRKNAKGLKPWIHFKMGGPLETGASLCQRCAWYSGSFAYLAHRQRSIFHHDAHLTYYRPCWVLHLHTKLRHLYESRDTWSRDSSTIVKGKTAKLRAFVKGFAIYHSKFGFAHFKGYRLNYVKKKFRCVGTLTARRLSLLFFKPSVRCWTTCRASRCCCGSPWSAGPVFRCATRRS